MKIMRITNILVNHMHEPLGFQLNNLRIEFTIEAEQYQPAFKELVIWDENNLEKPVYDTKAIPFDTNYFDVNISLNPRTRYQIKIGCVTGPLNAANNFCQAQSSFETGKMEEPFKADWIGNADKAIQNTLFKKTFSINKPIETARLYMSGLGVYETYLDNKKKGDEYLAPGITAYEIG